ncbi:hypothetical protein BGX30_006067 [Mortierella sp. GBA39]|nr:hypothetical protein BGX30_006067 [Mortierella sp. GBA39]
MEPFAQNLLQDKVVLITGGATGLGRAMGEKFVRLGAKLAIAGRREEVLKQTAEQFNDSGYKIFYAPCDVREPAQIAELADAVERHFGRIDILVNNAAGNFISPTERLSPRAVDAVLNIVLHGTFYATLEIGKRWIDRGQGGTMLAIAPGPFPTEGAWSRLSPTPELEQQMIDRVPLRRVGNKEELANLAAYLVSDYAGYINGEVVTIDGGEWLQGAGEFNDLRSVTEDQWDALAKLTRKGK